jgi:lysozyme
MTKLLLLLILPVLLFSDVELATKLIKQHEGFVSKPYIDNNHLSIGYGTSLRFGISKAEAELLLTHRLAIVEEQLKQFAWYTKQSDIRKTVLLDLTYNIGINGTLQFKSMLWALNRNYFNGAANAMKHSLWYAQTGTRAKQLVRMMRTNKQ